MADGLTGDERPYYVQLLELHRASQQVLRELMRKPWVEDTSDNLFNVEARIVQGITEIASRDEAAALQLVDRVDTLRNSAIDEMDVEAMGFLLKLLDSDPDGLGQLLSHPSLSAEGGDEMDRAIQLLYLGIRDPEAAEAIGSLAWVEESIGGRQTSYPERVSPDLEQRTLVRLVDSAVNSRKVLMALVSKPWMQDYLDHQEYSLAIALLDIAIWDKEETLRVLELPLLETVQWSDSTALRRLGEMAESDQVYFREVMSHPGLNEDSDFGPAATISLLFLRWKDLEAAVAIEALSWVSSAGQYPYDDTTEAAPAQTSLEQWTVTQMIGMALNSREAFMALVGKSWMQDSMTHWEQQATIALLDIVGREKEQGLSILEMPFLDTVEEPDALLLRMIHFLQRDDPADLQDLLARPELTGGITDGSRASVTLLLLEFQDPELESAVSGLTWVQDGIDANEEDALLVLQRMAQMAKENLIDSVLNKSWVFDGLTEDERRVIYRLTDLSSGTRAFMSPAVEILEMPFLQSVDAVDAAAIDDLVELWMGDYGLSSHLFLKHPNVSDGISDEEAAVIALSIRWLGHRRPAFVNTLMDPERTTLDKRVISLPLAGEITLAVLHIGNLKYTTLDLLEQSVRTQEEFMGVPFPSRFAGILVADVDPHSGGLGSALGRFTVDPGYRDNIGPISHETGHTYWVVGGSWIDEGGASLMEMVTRNALFGTPIGPPFTWCSIADNIKEFEQALNDPAVPRNNVYGSGCPYSLGQGLFLELYQELGRETFRQGFRRLYLKLDGREHGECTGLERGICYVKAAFVDAAEPGPAAIAESIIDRWYNGFPLR